MMINKDGKMVIEEVTIDEKGNRVVKNTVRTIDKDGAIVDIEETTDAAGNKIIKKTK